MGNWTSGYVADISYTFGYYAILNPLRIKLALLNKGLVCPEITHACELGFGQGVSTNMHAAASVVQWYGTDFNPAQASFAQELNKASDAGAKLYDQSFEEFAGRDDLPDFDFISLHGIWTWVSDENRKIIVDFIRRKLKVGGVLYISYNTQPGWAGTIPLRHLMTQHSTKDALSRGTVNRVDNALDFMSNLFKTNPGYLRAQPIAQERLNAMKTQDRHYLAHEYFNQEWRPMFFNEVAEYLEPAKIQYACSADFTEHVSALNLTSDQQKFMAELTDSVMRESVFDFMINQQFRRDYWVKGARQLSPLERFEELQKVRIILTTPRAEVSLTAKGALGEAEMSAPIYDPILDVIADHKIYSLGAIESALKETGIALIHIIEATLVLAGSGHIALVQEDQVISKARKKAEKLNAAIISKARSSEDVKYMASPVTGGGVPMERFAQLFTFAYTSGKKSPEEWVVYVWSILKAQNQRILKDKAVLESDEENMQELTRLAKEFSQKRMPILRALQII